MKSLYSSLCVLFFFLFSSPLFALDYYWVNGDGDWSDFANHWAKIPVPLVPGDYHLNVPGAMDDVFFTDNAGVPYTLNVDAGNTVPKCRNMEWTGVPAGTVWGGMGSRIDIYGSLKLDGNMSITFSGDIQFIAFGTFSTIMSDGVHFFGSVYFTGTGGGWTLLDAFYMDGSVVSHTGGLLNTNGQDVRVIYYAGGGGELDLGSSEFTIDGGYGNFNYLPANFIAGTSHIICNNASVQGNPFGLLDFYDVSFYGNGANGFAWGNVNGTLTFHGYGIIHGYNFSNVVQEYNNVIFEEDGLIYNAADYHHLTLTAGKTYTIQDYAVTTGTDQTILLGGTLTALGAGSCDQFITIKSWQYGTHFNFRNNSGATQTVHCAILEDCHAIGSDQLEVLDGVDLGNNTGWIFTNPHGAMDLYWIGGAGDWDDFNHWSETDGGPAGTCIPNGATNVFFTANSGFSAGNNLVNVPVDAYCKDMDWTGVTGNPNFYGSGGELYIYGSLTFAPMSEMDFSLANNTHFRSAGPATITNAEQTFQRVIFEGNGSWDFLDGFEAGELIHVDGTINTQGKMMYVRGNWYGNYTWPLSGVLSNKGAELWLGVVGGPSSIVTLVTFICEYEPEIGLDPENFHAVESELLVDANGYIFGRADHKFWKVTFPNLPLTYFGYFRGSILNKLTFIGPGLGIVGGGVQGEGSSLHEVEMQGEGRFDGNHSYDILTLTGGHGYEFENVKTQTISAAGSLNVVNTSCEGMAFLHTFYPLAMAKIAKTSGNLSLNNVILDYVFPDLTTGATYSATNSVGLQPQVITDWNLTNPAPRTLHWVGSAGDWSNSAHWSLNSGGAGGQCPPTPLDDVFFDGGSGLGGTDVVNLNQDWAFCKKMDWTGGSGILHNGLSPTNWNEEGQKLEVFGDLKFTNTMENDFNGVVYLRANQPATITSGGNHFKGNLRLWDPAGDWSLNDALYTGIHFRHHYGKFRTNDFPMTIAGSWEAGATPYMEAFMGNSTVTFDGNNNFGYGLADMYYLSGSFHCGTSSFIFDNGGYARITANGYNTPFYNVTFKGNNSLIWGAKIKNKLIAENYINLALANGDNYIHDAEFRGDALFLDSRNYHSMKFFPGKRYTFANGTTDTIKPYNGQEGQFIAQGLPGQYIEMKSDNFNTPAI
ncbi:MAG: hypothetical protein H7246_21325, partial [Phycisphaerae bacterium]|nr:hypothetical protein [Saprospiraceae bacterium]